MKHIKSYRVFESESMSWTEMIDLGIIKREDLPGIITSLDERDKLELVKSLFLSQFNDLTEVEKDDGDIIFYVDEDNLPLFYFYTGKNYVYINYRLWNPLDKVLGLKYPEILSIIKNWLEETYNLRSSLEPFLTSESRREWNEPIFESKEFTIPEMLELGLLDWADVQHVAKSPMKIAELILELVEKSVEEGGEIDTLYRYLEKLSIKSNWLRSEILKDFGLSVAPERERLTRLLFDKYSGLEQVKRGNQLYWIDAEGLPVLRKFIGDSEVFVNHYRIWTLFSDIFGLKTSEVQEIIRKWLSSVYGLELEGVRPTIDLHGNRMPIE